MYHSSFLPRGYLLNNQYVIDNVLGAGGFGITYLGIDKNSGEKLAIKEFLPSQFSYRDSNRVSITPNNSDYERDIYYKLLKRFKEEAKLLAELKHKNVVKVKEYFESNNSAYIVMSYIYGKDLNRYLEGKENLSEKEIKELIIPVLDGLSEVHAKGYLHRDISPDNIYMRENSIPMLIDFGAARFSMGEKSGMLTAIAKAGYSPPEQYTANREQFFSSDLYAISAVIYRMITGKRPVESVARQMALLNGEKDPLENLEEKYSGEYSPKFLQTVMKGLNVKQSERISDIQSFKSGIKTKRGDINGGGEGGGVQIIHIVIWGLVIVYLFFVFIGIFST